MAFLISKTTGNFGTASTWGVVDTTSLLDSEANNTALTTSYVASASFAPMAITVDGVALKIFSVSNSPTGTLSVELYNLTTATSISTVTIDVADIPLSITSGWMFFKFSSSVLMVAAQNYQIRAKTSSASMVNLNRNATAGNWTRALRTTTTAAPAASDQLVIAGEYTAPATSSDVMVTFQGTSSAISYGKIEVAAKGILNFDAVASTNYYLKLAGNLELSAGCSFLMSHGTSGTASLEFACTTPVQYGLEIKNGAAFAFYGDSKTLSVELNADAIAGATSLTVTPGSGWLNGDQIALPSTSRTASEAEKKSLTANASGSTLTVAALTNAHSGTGDTKAKIINLTRSCKIFSTSTTNNTYVRLAANSINGAFNDVEFYNMGSATLNKRGLQVDVSAAFPGSVSVTGCALHDFTAASSIGVFINSSTSSGFNLVNTVIYNTASYGVYVTGGSGIFLQLSNISVIRAGSSCIHILELTGVIANSLYASSSTAVGIHLGETSWSTGSGYVSGIVTHSNATNGLRLDLITVTDEVVNPRIYNVTSWRNTTGVTFNACHGVKLEYATLFGNVTSNIAAGLAYNCKASDVTMNGGATHVAQVGVDFTGHVNGFKFDSCSFGLTTIHPTGDIRLDNLTTTIAENISFRSCSMGSTAEIVNQSSMNMGSLGIGSSRHDTNAEKFWKRYGTLTKDTSIFRSGSASVRATPNNTTFKLQATPRIIPVRSGSNTTVRVYVRKSVAGDGTAYAGNEARLILKQDASMSVAADVICQGTTAAAIGAWELLTYTTATAPRDGAFTFLIDCDGFGGPVGWINIDDWSAT